MKKIPQPPKPKQSQVSIGPDYPYPPTLELTSKQVPEVKDWKVGGKYTITVQIEQTSMNKSQYGSDTESVRCSFKVLAYEIKSGNKKQTNSPVEDSYDSRAAKE